MFCSRSGSNKSKSGQHLKSIRVINYDSFFEPTKNNGKIRRGQIDALHTQVQVVDIDNGLIHQIPFAEIYCYPESVSKETSAIICMLPLFFGDGVDDLGQTEKLNPDKLDSFVTVSNKNTSSLSVISSIKLILKPIERNKIQNNWPMPIHQSLFCPNNLPERRCLC